MTTNNVYMKSGNCPSCDFPLDEFGDCTNSDCDTNLISEHEYKDPLDEKDNRPEDDDYSDMFDDEDEDEEETDEFELGVD